MAYSLTEAAAAAGRNRSTIVRAIKAGRLSASRDAASNEWRIEPAELHRLYPVADASGTASGDASAVLQAQLEAERAMVSMLERVNEDLRRRLDLAAAQLTEALVQNRLLTDQRAVAPPAPARRGWWRWRR